jgi:hypothetical protein
MRVFIAKRLMCALFVALAALAALAAPAAETTPLPAFEVIALDGSTVRSDELPVDDKWLLVYMQPHCRPCDGLLRLFENKEEGTDHSRKVVVVVGGASAEEVGRMAEKTPWLPQSSWYADPRRQAARALRIQGSPVVMGVLNRNVEWNLAGVAADEERLKSILATWNENQPPTQPTQPPQP